jgi:hypothetical protein
MMANLAPVVRAFMKPSSCTRQVTARFGIPASEGMRVATRPLPRASQ